MEYNTFLNNLSSGHTNLVYNMHPHCSNLYNFSSSSSLSAGPTLNQPYANRFVYVNQNFVNPAPSKSILINPNFKQTVHINPNFKASAPPTNSTIHVNPGVLKLETVTQKKETRLESTKVVSTRTKLIRVSGKSPPTQLDASAKRKRRKSLHTKYKIIRSSKCDSPKAETAGQKFSYATTKFKIDRSSPGGIKKRNSPSKSKLLSIGGVLYKKTPNVLKRANSNNKLESQQRNKVLRIGAHIYKLDSNRKTLKRIDLKEGGGDVSKANVKRIASRQQKVPNVYVKSNVNKKLLLLSQVKRWSTQILPSKLRKCNLPCPIYRRFGKCRGKESGTCIRIHNPDQIALCTRFLQGACIDKSCLLSHKVSPEKMPTCKYFLEGLCSKEDCPYLHVKISPKAPICKDFLEGFCKNAEECDKRHQFLCPDYDKNGTCVGRRCPYPHGKMVRELTKARNNVAKKVVNGRFAKASPLAEQGEVNYRYYEGKKVENNGNLIKPDGGGGGVENQNADDNVSSGRGRPKLGCLPSFIPLGQPR